MEGTQSRGKPRSKLVLRATLKRCKTPPPFTIPRCFIETGTRDVNSANFVAETNFPPLSCDIMILCTAFVFTFSRDTKLEENYEGEGGGGGIFENLELEGGGCSSEDDDDRRANFLRGGKREKGEKIEWKFIVGQPMLMLRARGKIEIGLHFRERWRVGGSTVRTERSTGFLLEGGRGGPYILSVHEISRNRGCPAWQPLAASTAREITLRS